MRNIIRGQLGNLFAMDTASLMCLLELVIGAVVPVYFFWSYTLRRQEMTKKMIVRNALLMVLGVTLNRGNVVFTGMAKAAGTTYFPSAAELFLSIGLISVGILVYLFIVENFDVFPEHRDIRITGAGGGNEQSRPGNAGLARA